MTLHDEAKRSTQVMLTSAQVPGFGQADLSNCELEQIHLAGSIRPCGAFLLVREPDLTIVQQSADAGRLLGRADSVLGETLDGLGGNLAERVRTRTMEQLTEVPAAVRCRVAATETDFDGLLHRPPGGGLIVELIPAGPARDLTPLVRDALRRVSAAASLQVLSDETAGIFKALAGYDRVMVYRFDERGHGEVFAEAREPGLEPFLGNRYPATDIPQIARRLYMRNRIRILEDVAYCPVPLIPEHSPLTGEPLDMSLCYLRSLSPIHIQYLKNMGVAATLVTSLMVGGRLWGLISCHHQAPRSIQYQTRIACELLAEAVATRIAALQGFTQAQTEHAVRRLEQRMIEAITRRGDWEHALFDNPQSLLQPLAAGGAVLLCDGKVVTTGTVPGTHQIGKLRAWLDTQPRAPVIATASLGSDAPGLADLIPVASGLLAVPLSRGGGEYLVWLRPERLHTVTWGGNPYQTPEHEGDDPGQLSPRRSFARWQQVVEGTSDPWTPDDLTTARLIGESVADVIQQFRSLRVLIARDQLEDISRKVRHSEQPVVIADARGLIVLTNGAFDRLVPGGTRPGSLGELLGLFGDPAAVNQRILDLLKRHQPWRAEVELTTSEGERQPFMVRADPVLSAPEQVLGFVFLFTDISERKTAEEARRRFQTGVVERHRLASKPLESETDLVRRELLAGIVGNAQLAALEITDGPDLTRVPDLLEGIQSSVTRTTDLLEHLLWYSDRAAGDSDRGH